MTRLDAEADARFYRDFSQAIFSVEPAAPSAKRDPLDALDSAGMIVYRNNVRASLLRVLQETFPVIHRLVGESFFRLLAHEYFHAHPPMSPLVARYGDAFPLFLQGFEPARGLAYLPDMARLEHAWLGAYHAAEAESMTPECFLALLHKNPNACQLRLHPSVRLIASSFPIHAIWLHTKRETAGKLQIPAKGENVVIRRPAHHVLTDAVSAPLFAALAALQRGASFGDALSAAVSDGDENDAAAIIHTIATMTIITATGEQTGSQ